MTNHSAPSTERNGRHSVKTDNTNCSTWGDNITSANNNKESLKIMFQNINGLGYNKSTSKAELLRSFIHENNIDIMMVAEVNVNWKLVSKTHSIHQLSKQWFENQVVSTAYNHRIKHKSKHLPGGTAIICQGETALRKIKCSDDANKLGRWSSVLLRGKNQLRLRAVSVYVPCISNTYGSKKVYCQQQKALLAMKDKTSVIAAFWRDFWKQTDEWLDDGEQLIIAGDWNVDIQKDQFTKPFRERNLVPAITGKHKNLGTPPETFSKGGRFPIDEIMVSSTIQINNAGYLAHGDGVGDHRPIWIEVSKESALGSKLPNLPSFAARRLKCTDPRIITKYNSLLLENLEKTNFFERADALFKNFKVPLSNKQELEYEQLDRIRVKAMKKAEKNCRHLYMGAISWSPELQRIRNILNYLHKCVSRLKGTEVNAKTLIRLSKKAKIDAQTLTMEQVLRLLDKAYENYKVVKLNHDNLRKAYLIGLAEALESAGKGRKASNLKNLISVEEQRTIFRKLKRINGKDIRLGTTFVSVQTPDGNSKDIVDKEGIEEAISAANLEKYHQTETTCPFIFDKQLRNDFGEYGEGSNCAALFGGTYKIPDHVDRYTRAFLETCKHQDGIPHATFERTMEEYKRSWEIMDERISSRELHFGHFKAACQTTKLINMHYQMAEIPFRTGYAPTRWKNATQVMILKKEGIYDVNKLRTIVLYEADFNHNNKYFGRQMMQHTKQHNLMAEEQYSTPGKKAIDHALNRRLIFDITRYQKSSLAMTSCDLKSCYDRIAHSPAFLAMAGYKFLPTPIWSMFNCIQDMQWTTRTAYGDSNSTFGGLHPAFKAKPQGVGQGNGAGPPVWSVVSSRMFEVLHDNDLSTKFTAPISGGHNLDICGFAFVDDSDIIASSRVTNDPDSTVRQMQKTIDFWEGVAKSTGGALEPSKSWWYLLHFNWDEGNWSYGDLNNVMEDTLTAKDKNNNRVELQHLPSNKAQKMLGVELAPDGNNELQVNTLLTKSKKMAELARVGHITNQEAWIALNVIALKSLEYGLPASTLTEQELNKIMAPILTTYLPKSGINRNIKRDLLYGPINLQGLGVNNPYITQGISHIVDIIDHSWRNSLTGKLIQQCLEHLRLELGTNGSILTKSYEAHKPLLLNSSWITNAWEFMSKHKIKIQENTTEIKLRREGDVLLMEEVLKSKAVSNNIIKKANKCRIFLKAASLADITSGDGKNIAQFALTGVESSRQTRHQYSWPKWGKPSKSDWAAWREVLRKVFCKNKKGTLDKPLSRWIEHTPKNWEWYISNNSYDQDLYHLTYDNKWEKFKKKGRSIRQPRYNKIPEQLSEVNRKLLQPTTIKESIQEYISEGTSPKLHPTNTTTPNLQQLEWLHYSIKPPNKIGPIIESIKSGTAIAVSDGSFDPFSQMGTAAWTITTPDTKQSITGTCISPGPQNIQNPYRSEILGILGILDHVQHLTNLHNITRGGILIACDGISALRQAMRQDISKITCKSKQSDLLSACAKIIQALPITIQHQHVRGHQDEVKPFEELSTLEILNSNMDFEAKLTLQTYINIEPLRFAQANPHPLSFLPVSIKKTPIQSDILHSLRQQITAERLHEYWINNNRYRHRDKKRINWCALGKAMKATSSPRRKFISKWTSEFLGTGKNMKRWKLRPHDNCPYCSTPEEDTQHILKCQHQAANQQWTHSLYQYTLGLLKLGLDLAVIIPIKRELDAWRQNKHITNHNILQYSSQVQSLLRAQRRLGWKQFLEGLLDKRWNKYIQTILDFTNPQSTNKLISKVIQLNWNLISSTWSARNKQLHLTEKINELEGRPQLIQAIEEEWKVGLSILPHNDFGYLFTIPKKQLLQKSIDCLKGWFSIVRQGRELYQDPRRLIDEFSTPGALRSWIGLPALSQSNVSSTAE